jgi:hypothetical protein
VPEILIPGNLALFSDFDNFTVFNFFLRVLSRGQIPGTPHGLYEKSYVEFANREKISLNSGICENLALWRILEISILSPKGIEKLME